MNWKEKGYNATQVSILEAFASGAKGITDAATKAKVTRQTVHNQLKDEKFNDEVKRAKALYLQKLNPDDAVMAVLTKKALEGDTKAINMVLKEKEKEQAKESALQKTDEKPSLDEIKRSFGNITDGLIRAVRKNYRYVCNDEQKAKVREKYSHWFSKDENGNYKLKKFYTFREERELFEQWKNERKT